MDRYGKLLAAAVGHVTPAHNRIQTASLGIGASRDFILPRSSEAPRAAAGFELVTLAGNLEPLVTSFGMPQETPVEVVATLRRGQFRYECLDRRTAESG